MMSSQELKSVLATGGCGFIGYHLVSRLLETSSNSHISVLDLPTSLPRYPNVKYYEVDVSIKPDVQDALEKIRLTVIFHATCNPTYSLALPAEIHNRINTLGTINVLQATQSVGTVKAFVYHSSSSVMEDGLSSMYNSTETSPVLFAPRQKFPYPLSKALAEKAVLEANRKNGILTTSIRPAGTFGEADYEMIGRLVASAQSGRANVQIGDGSNPYDFLYVGNLVPAHLLAAKALLRASYIPEDEIREKERVDGEVFNITNDEPWLFWDFHREVAKQAGFPVRKEDIKILPRWLMMVIAFFAKWWVWVFIGGRESTLQRSSVRYACLTKTLSCGKAKRVLGYRPTIGIQEGIERSLRLGFRGEGEEGEGFVNDGRSLKLEANYRLLPVETFLRDTPGYSSFNGVIRCFIQF
jgi:sterol-4alpha-carboxylate 3-dehydrogenase (decarboxylating)